VLTYTNHLVGSSSTKKAFFPWQRFVSRARGRHNLSIHISRDAGIWSYSRELALIHCAATLCDSDRCGHWCPPRLCNVGQRPYMLYQAHRASRCTAFHLLAGDKELYQFIYISVNKLFWPIIPTRTLPCLRTSLRYATARSHRTAPQFLLQHAIRFPAFDTIGVLLVTPSHWTFATLQRRLWCFGHLVCTP